jgi:RNA polymerase sigma-54 factor
MAMSPRLDLRQSQSLVMTPQLQQAIKLLQLSNMDLGEYVDAELQRNPLLEREDSDGPAQAEALAADNMVAYEAATERERGNGDAGPEWDPADGPDSFDETSRAALPSAAEDPRDTDYDNEWSSAAAGDPDYPTSGLDGSGFASPWQSSGGGGSFDNEDFDLERTLTAAKTLREHLLEQLSVEISAPADRLIAAHLIDLVDDAGYLTGDLAVVAEELGCPLETAEAVLERLQHFDPAGVFARNLAECLALQLRDRNRLDPAIQAMLDNLPMLAARDMPGLMRKCGVDAEDMAEMIDEIRSLNPKPGLAFEPVNEEPVIPDVLMRRTQDGGWLVELNADALPRVLVNNSYYARVARKVGNKEDKTYLSECLQSANWLVKSLHQRATTILKVSSEIIRQQTAFFDHGVQYLKPIILKDIAEAISMHESTVSRVTSNKYIATPRGVYELKYFFTSSIASAAGGDAHSAESVRHRIKELIEAETVAEVLSDDRLVEILRGQGIDIARRTVAKYREALRIPSSVKRKRDKAFGV